MKPLQQRLLAVDPGAKYLGWAVFSGDPPALALACCGFMSIADLPDCWWRPDELVVEVPQIYPQRAWKGDPNDLVNVALAAGIVIGRVRCKKVLTPRPHQWKGNVPKAIHHKRVIACLSVEERVVLNAAYIPASKKHNCIDAVGLGLWALKRL